MHCQSLRSWKSFYGNSYRRFVIHKFIALDFWIGMFDKFTRCCGGLDYGG